MTSSSDRNEGQGDSLPLPSLPEITPHRAVLLALWNGVIAALICIVTLMFVFGALGGGNDPFGVGSSMATIDGIVVWLVVTVLSWVVMHLWFFVLPRSSNKQPPSTDE